MRILLINNQHLLKGGAHAVYFNTAELLKKYGHEVYFFSLKTSDMIEYKYSNYFPKAINYREISLLNKLKFVNKFIYNKEAYRKLNKYIKFIKPDIAHIHLFMGGLTVSILESLKENKIPIIHTVHDYRLICPAYTFLDKNNKVCEKCRDGFYIRCLYKKCSFEKNYIHSTMLSLDAYYRNIFINPLSFIDSYIFVSDFSKNLHISFNSKYKKRGIKIYNFNANIENSKKSNRGDYILYFGRLSREKGVDLLISAAKELKVKLKIAGTGSLYYELLEKSDENIEILGFKKGEDLLSIIENCSFVIVPSQCYENNPMSIIEAFSFGKPVIGSKTGGIPEIIDDKKTGFLFEMGNIHDLGQKILMAKNINDKEYTKMSENARIYAENNFSPEKHYIQLIDYYNKTIIKCETKKEKVLKQDFS